MYTGRQASTPPMIRSGCDWVNTACAAGTPLT